MSNSSDLDKVEATIDYFFQDKDLLKLSLTAAGTQPGQKYDGNRKLARTGWCVIHLAITDSNYVETLTSDEKKALRTFFNSKKGLSAFVDFAGLVNYIELCERTPQISDRMKGNALSALLGAAWKDSNCLDTVAKIMTRLCRLNKDACGHPRLAEPPFMVNSNLKALPGTVNPLDTLLTKHVSLFDLTASESCPVGMFPMIDQDVNIVGAEWEPVSPSRFLESVSGSPPAPIFERPQAEISDLSLPSLQEAGGNASFLRRKSIGERLRKQPRKPGNPQYCYRWFREYIKKAEERCNKMSLHSPWMGFPTQKFINEMADFSVDIWEIFLRFWVGLCSPASLIELQDTIQRFRGDNSFLTLPPEKNLSFKDRMYAIDRAEQNIACWVLLRRLHVLQLCKDEQVSTVNKNSWIIFNGTQDLHPNEAKRAGNPRNKRESDATKELLQHMLPELEEGSPDYPKLYHRVKRLRKLGQRLEMLELRFGQGLLALMPCSEFASASLGTSAISDAMLLAPTNGQFEVFLNLLDKTEGVTIRKFSASAGLFVKQICDGTLGQSERSRLELSSREHLSTLARGSELLLFYLST